MLILPLTGNSIGLAHPVCPMLASRRHTAIHFKWVMMVDVMKAHEGRDWLELFAIHWVVPFLGWGHPSVVYSKAFWMLTVQQGTHSYLWVWQQANIVTSLPCPRWASLPNWNPSVFGSGKLGLWAAFLVGLQPFLEQQVIGRNWDFTCLEVHCTKSSSGFIQTWMLFGFVLIQPPQKISPHSKVWRVSGPEIIHNIALGQWYGFGCNHLFLHKKTQLRFEFCCCTG